MTDYNDFDQDDISLEDLQMMTPEEIEALMSYPEKLASDLLHVDFLTSGVGYTLGDFGYLENLLQGEEYPDFMPIAHNKEDVDRVFAAYLAAADGDDK
jgi:hypothetical protein